MNWVSLLANPFSKDSCVKDCHDTFGKNNKPKYLKKCVAACHGVLLGKGLADLPQSNPAKQHVREMPLPVFAGTMGAFNDPDFGTFDEVVRSTLADRSVLNKMQATIRRRTQLKVDLYIAGEDLVAQLGNEKRVYRLSRGSLSSSLAGLFGR